MIETIKTLILDFQAASLETGTPRELIVETVPGKATVCIGVRRSGKSTFLYQLIRRLLDSGVSRENILYLNFFDDRIYNLHHDDLGLIIQAYFSLFPEKKGAETIYCFFDEIQSIENWEPFIDRILRTEKCKVYITGSSANLLSKEIATQMRGRALSWEIFPFSFGEFLDSRDIKRVQSMTTKQQLTLSKAFGDYWETGGFPEVIAISKPLRIKTHQEYLNTLLFRDIIERHDIAHPRAVIDLAHWLIDNAASLYSVNKLTGYLQSLGHKCPKSSVSEYMKWFEDAYFMFTVRIFDASLSRSNSNPKKIYCIDHALAASVSSGILLNSGHLLENLVFVALRRVYSDIFYYKTKSGREVDFIIKQRKSSCLLIQVCETLADPRTRKREIDALVEAMGELELTSATILTRGEEDSVISDTTKVRIMPVWRFLVELGA